ncbi:LamG domain-containing protein [Acinetobacter sp.]|uniref:LamG domain-containing protein n=1 Tax=Acinetobacter sp. TaxID=472 RepID=UPI003D06E255
MNSPVWKNSGAFAGARKALDFDGVNDYVSILAFPDFYGSMYQKNYTISVWFKTAFSPANRQDIIYLRENVADEDYLSINLNSAGQLTFIVRTECNVSQNQFTTDDSWNDNQWHQLAVTKNESTHTLYIDGHLKGTFELGITSDMVLHKFAIGISHTDTYNLGFPFNGQIDEVRIWNTARTSSEIRENMMRQLDGNESGLLAYYRLNETTGTVVYDATSNGHNGTLINMDGATDWVDSEAFTTWLGTNSPDWVTVANWSDGVPTSTDNVGIYKWDLGSEATISGSPVMENILFSSGASPTLGSDFTVNGKLLLQKNLDLNGKTINLGANATLSEGDYRIYGTTGEITTTRSLSGITSQNVGGLGAVITTAANMGSTTIKRAHSSQAQVTGGKSMLRTYQINPQNNTGLSATLVYNYHSDELNGISEAQLALHKSTDAGATFIWQGGTTNAANNTLTLTGIGSFSLWTAGLNCNNPTNGGIIGNAQTICTGSTPAMLTETTSPTGTIAGTLQYQWQSSTTSAVAGFADISGATSSTCQPDVLTQTTWYKRLVKVDCETNWLESNVVEVTVNPLQQFRTKADLDYTSPRNWTTAANWEQYNGSGWVAATSYPGEISNACSSPLVTILTGHQMEIIGVNITLPNLKMEGAGKLFVRSTGKIYVNGQLQLDQNSAGAIVVE